MQKGRRGNVTSVDEPNAFRIARGPRSFDAPTSNQRDGQSTFISDYPPTPHAPFSRSVPDFVQLHSQPFEPASWLTAPDLSSPTFSAHDFLQRVLSQRYDKAARPTHIPVLEDSFDADAALAALDTVESALRKKRDIARREEEVARDDLRKALHLSAKKREQLVRTADTVSSNITTFGDVGRQASSALNADVKALKAAAEILGRLQDARDLVSLLTTENCELDAVRVSKLLAKARQHIEDGSLADLLPDDDMAVAREEMGRCESELAFSVDAWMKSAVDSGQIHIVRECALAAEELNTSQSFIDSYISHVLAFDQVVNTSHVSDGNDTRSSPESLEQFRAACWETTSAVGEIIPTICESFPRPSRALASVLRMLSQKKIIAAAEAIISRLSARIQVGEGKVSEDSADADSAYPPSARSSVERIRNLAIADTKENWREGSMRTSGERKRFLVVCTEVFKSMAKLKCELLTQAVIPGAEDVRELFSESSDPFVAFSNRWIMEYLKNERTWVEEQFGAAFFDITRIEAHAPRLAPREASAADVYHRYRAFYSHISSQYQEMTRSAIESTYESICRAAAVLSSISAATTGTIEPEPSIYAEHVTRTTRDVDSVAHDRFLESGKVGGTRPVESGRYSLSDDVDDSNLFRENLSLKTPNDGTGMRKVLREILDGLVMRYLANSETILQAATHLLPVSETDARMQELWVSGASPLTAYMQAIEVLSRSNEMLDEFLLTLEMADHISEVCVPLTSDDVLSKFVPQETRELLHRELTSGLSDLGAEAQVGVRAAVSSVRARLFAMLSTSAARKAYVLRGQDESCGSEVAGDGPESNVRLDLEPSPAFMSSSTFIEQQLQSVLSSVHGGNRDFVISELCVITREAVLHCWCSCEGPVSFCGALQLVADGRAMTRVFQSHRESASIVDCLPAVGELFLESAEGLWKCVESKSLTNVEARTLVELLKKREDRHAERVVKVCQSLGATLEELQPNSESSILL